MNSEYVLVSRDTPTAGSNLIPISVPFNCSCVGSLHFHTIMYLVTLLALDSLSLADC